MKPNAQRKNNRDNRTHAVGLFFYLRLSPVQRYRYYNSIREILRNHGLRVFERILVSC